jgi:hypothetical protein
MGRRHKVLLVLLHPKQVAVLEHMSWIFGLRHCWLTLSKFQKS